MEYIERDAARQGVFCIGVSCQDCPFLISPLYGEYGGCRIDEFIASIPAADVKPAVKARWNEVKYPLYECSNCGAVYQDVGYGFNYCPNCGARMVTEDV